MDLQLIQNKIFEIRGQRVMLDFHLADLYRTEAKVLNQSVKRNMERFPDDFMFQLSEHEFKNLKSQIVTSNRGGIRRPPYAFTELGVAMLSSVLRSPVAIEINIQIIRAFVELRKLILGYEELRIQIKEPEDRTNINLNEIYQILAELSKEKAKSEKPFNPVGYLSYD